MDLQTLRFFTAAAEAGSFSSTAEKLHYAQSNLSNRIKQLEEELEEPLFYRSKQGVSLTAKGELFYEYALRVLQLSDEAVTVIRDWERPRGKLALGSLEATALHDLPELLSAYHKSYPEVSLSLQTDMNDVFPGQVLSRKLEGAFVAGPVSHPELEEIDFKTEELILVSSGDERSRDVESILTYAPLITFPEGSVGCTPMFTTAGSVLSSVLILHGYTPKAGSCFFGWTWTFAVGTPIRCPMCFPSVTLPRSSYGWPISAPASSIRPSRSLPRISVEEIISPVSVITGGMIITSYPFFSPSRCSNPASPLPPFPNV